MLPPRWQAIYDGTSGHSPYKRAAFLRSWLASGVIDAIPEGVDLDARREPTPRRLSAEEDAGINEGPCLLRGESLRDQRTDSCGCRDKTRTIYACPIHEECFEGQGGFRVGSGRGPSRRIEACRHCPDHRGSTTGG